ncbi:MAG: hypothetical protein QNJ81_02380 [Acidimicrobiia bacterium]|nr:hypothetical protein [Acidimicrobiia bacterium]
MLKRLLPSRWARIVAWTGAAVAWGTSVVAVQAATEEAATPAPEPVDQPLAEVQEVPPPVAGVPEAPAAGLIIVRYTPVPPPPPEVITRTITVGGGSGGGGTTSAAGGGGDRPTINDVVVSSGS